MILSEASGGPSRALSLRIVGLLGLAALLSPRPAYCEPAVVLVRHSFSALTHTGLNAERLFESIAERLQAGGFQLVEDPEAAELVVHVSETAELVQLQVARFGSSYARTVRLGAGSPLEVELEIAHKLSGLVRFAAEQRHVPLVPAIVTPENFVESAPEGSWELSIGGRTIWREAIEPGLRLDLRLLGNGRVNFAASLGFGGAADGAFEEDISVGFDYWRSDARVKRVGVGVGALLGVIVHSPGPSVGALLSFPLSFSVDVHPQLILVFRLVPGATLGGVAGETTPVQRGRLELGLAAAWRFPSATNGKGTF